MTRVRLLLTAMVVALPVLASAQQVDRPPAEPFRRWDADGGFTIRFGEGDDRVIALGSWIAQAGRYWTPHLKTTVAVTTAGQHILGSYTFTGNSSISSDHITRPAAYGVGLTYQFFDNEFVHPYVTGGARFASSYESVVRRTYTQPFSIQVVTSDGPDRLEVRPVVGGGFKSYFANGRAFMRTELLFAFAPNGTRHAILQIGSGVDF